MRVIHGESRVVSRLVRINFLAGSMIINSPKREEYTRAFESKNNIVPNTAAPLSDDLL
jgi:hypothetical protein